MLAALHMFFSRGVSLLNRIAIDKGLQNTITSTPPPSILGSPNLNPLDHHYYDVASSLGLTFRAVHGPESNGQ